MLVVFKGLGVVAVCMLVYDANAIIGKWADDREPHGTLEALETTCVVDTLVDNQDAECKDDVCIAVVHVGYGLCDEVISLRGLVEFGLE